MPKIYINRDVFAAFVVFFCVPLFIGGCSTVYLDLDFMAMVAISEITFGLLVVVPLVYAIINEPWYVKEYAFEDVLKLSSQLLQNYDPKESNIYGIGQSPAWIIEGAKILVPKNKDSFYHIAFSSRFVKRVYNNNDPEVAVFEKLPNFPNAQAIQSYRNYLSKEFLDPQSIRLNFTEGGVKTVIMEYSETGEGLASFMAILCSWAQELKCLEEVHRNTQLVCIKNSNIKLPMSYLKEPITSKSFKINWIHGNAYARYDLHGHNRNIVDTHLKASNANAADRLVAYYPPQKWNEPPLLDNKPRVIAMIHEELQNSARKSFPNCVFEQLGDEPIETIISRINHKLGLKKTH